MGHLRTALCVLAIGLLATRVTHAAPPPVVFLNEIDYDQPLTALLYKIPKIVIGENRTFHGPEDYVRSRGVELTILNDPECIKLMEDFITAKPELWNEDIGQQ